MNEKEMNPEDVKELLLDVKEHIVRGKNDTKDIDKINQAIAFFDGLIQSDDILLETECDMAPLSGIVIQNSTVFIGKQDE